MEGGSQGASQGGKKVDIAPFLLFLIFDYGLSLPALLLDLG